LQIDFHHTVTYVCARLAGFGHEDADIIAYSSQYVDDAQNEGTINFDNGSCFTRNASSFSVKNYSDFKELKEKYILIPFHYLPGNGGNTLDKEVKGGYHSKLKCTQNSFIAKDMIKGCFDDKDKPYALHRLGIALNVYSDTFVHYGFSGIPNDTNKIELVKISKINEKENNKEDENWHDKLKEFFDDKYDEKEKSFSPECEILGHAAVLSYPDLPYIKWRHKKGNRIEARNNAFDMFSAVKHIYKILYTYKREMSFGSLQFKDINIPDKDFDLIYENFINFDLSDKKARHIKWLEFINENNFSFDMDDELSYKNKGVNSWKHKALGEIKEFESGEEVYKYDNKFLSSNWKLFHDALKSHRLDVVHNILPRYGICVG
jgi:hypothetical protein